MSEATKSCNLTKTEIMMIVENYGRNVAADFSTTIERLSYLHKRLKAFDEPETETKSAAPGWGTPPKE